LTTAFFRCSKSRVIEILRRQQIIPKKGLGQHFIVDGNFAEFVVRSADILPSEDVIEIGSGVGSLTSFLLRKAKTVWAFEIDRNLYLASKDILGDAPNLNLFNEDGIKAQDICPGDREYKMISSLPYANYFDLILACLKSNLHINGYYLIVQQDVYEKMIAVPSSKKYTPLAVFIQATCNISLLRRVPKTSFYPIPKIDSVFIKFTVQENPLMPPHKLKDLMIHIKTLFGYRRKLLKNVLLHCYPAQYPKLIRHLGSRLTGKRVEELTVKEIIEIAENFTTLIF